MAHGDPRLVVLAGGISSRMKAPSNVAIDPDLLHQTEERTKGMLGVGHQGRPFLDYLLYNARRAGLTDIVIVIGERDESVRSYYGSADRGNEFFGLSISYALQKIPAGRTKPLGTADATLQALRTRTDWRGGDFIVCNSDNLYSTEAFSALLTCEAPNCLIDYDRSGLEFDEQRIAQFGITRKDAEGYLIEIVEKPNLEQLEQLRETGGILRVSMNVFRLNYDMVYPFLEQCPLHPTRGEKELVMAVTLMAQSHPKSVRAIPWKEHVPDLTYKEDIPRVQRYLVEHFGSLSW
jgi:glucose-1-phosphate adenylyltransferase